MVFGLGVACIARRVQVKVRGGRQVMRDRGKRRDWRLRHPQGKLVNSVDVLSMSVFALAQHCGHTVLARTGRGGEGGEDRYKAHNK